MNLRFATFTLLLAVGLLLGGYNVLVASTVEAQSVPVEVEVTPGNFATFFNVDANNVGTLKPAYSNDHTLAFVPGVYPHGILIQNASNLALRGAEGHTSIIRVGHVIEGVQLSQEIGVVAVRGSTDVSIEGFDFNFDCLSESPPTAARLYTIFFSDSSGAISNNKVNDLSKAPYHVGTPSSSTECGRDIGMYFRVSKRHIHVRTTSAYAPTIDASGKVTNLLPVEISNNEVINVPASFPFLVPVFGIQVSGYIDATITGNVIREVSRGVSLVGGASGSVSDNTIVPGSVGILYTPNSFVPNSPDGETIESHLEIRNNEIRDAPTAISLGSGWCVAQDGTRINTNARIVGNLIHGIPGNTASIQVASCRGAEDERIKAEIVGNTFDADLQPGETPRGFGIFAGPAFNSGTSAEAWFDINVKFNTFKGYLVGVRLTNLNGGNRYGVSNAKIDASDNYWGDEEPTDLYIQDIVQDPTVAPMTYAPWLKNEKYSGHEGPYARGTRQLTDLPPSFSLSPQKLTVKEAQSAIFDVELDTSSSYDDVHIEFSSLDPDLSFSPNPVVFTPENRRDPQTVTVRAARDDDLIDETTRIVARSSADDETASIEVQIADALLQAHHRISKLKPSVKEFTIGPGEVARIGVVPYGVQDIADNALIDGKTDVIWSLEMGGGDFREADAGLDADDLPNDREVIFTSPASPGSYQVHATLATCEEGDTSARCRATFIVKVLRSSRFSTESKPEPVNPPGELPSILADSDGNQYEVFTPSAGGAFNGESSSLKADPGAVPNGEIVGLRIAEGDAASNAGRTHHRYTLGGNWHEISAVDASGEAISSYALNNAAEVCVPLPDVLRANISDVVLVAINSDDSLTILSSRVRITASSTNVCGNISLVPANIAVGSAGAPAPLPTEVPEPEEGSGLPETGGGAPSSAYGLIWTLLIGLFSVIAGGFAVMHGRLRRAFTAVKSHSSTG